MAKPICYDVQCTYAATVCLHQAMQSIICVDITMCEYHTSRTMYNSLGLALVIERAACGAHAQRH